MVLSSTSDADMAASVSAISTTKQIPWKGADEKYSLVLFKLCYHHKVQIEQGGAKTTWDQVNEDVVDNQFISCHNFLSSN